MMKLFSNIPDMRKIPEQPLAFIWEALYGVRRWMFVAAMFAFSLQLMKVFVPVVFSDMINYFTKITPDEFSWSQMWWFLVFIFVSYIGQSVFRMVRELIENNRVISFMIAKIKLFTVDYLAKHSEKYFSSQKTGQLSQKVDGCAERTVNAYCQMSRLFSNVSVAVVNFFYIGRVSLWFLLLVIIFGLTSAFISYKTSFKLRELDKKVSDAYDDFQGILADSINNTLNIKAAGSEDYELSFIKRKFGNVKTLRLDFWGKFQNSVRWQQTMICLFEISIFLLLIRFWYVQKISVGDVTLILLLMNNVMACFNKALWNICDLNSNLGALRAAMSPFIVKHDIIDMPKAKKLKVTEGVIEFKNVCFAYEKNKKVFNRLNLKIKAKEKVGLVGLSGSGKSTLINLLQRAYDIDNGEILIDGQNIAKVTLASLHEAIALIPQDTSLFHRTISQNIGYGNLRAGEAKIVRAAKKAYADGFIKKLPKGYQTPVGEKGVKLSGGERQRVAIARAILKNSPILILDEATSALDSKTETAIQKAMQNLMNNKTVIAIAHRLSTLKEMDRIIVLDKGKIVEEGTIEELLSVDGAFKRFWNVQRGRLA